MGLQQGRLHRLRTNGAWELALIRGCGRRLTPKIYGLPSARKGSESRTGTTSGACCTRFAPNLPDFF